MALVNPAVDRRKLSVTPEAAGIRIKRMGDGSGRELWYPPSDTHVQDPNKAAYAGRALFEFYKEFVIKDGENETREEIVLFETDFINFFHSDRPEREEKFFVYQMSRYMGVEKKLNEKTQKQEVVWQREPDGKGNGGIPRCEGTLNWNSVRLMVELFTRKYDQVKATAEAAAKLESESGQDIA